jgi:hypothetical protein
LEKISRRQKERLDVLLEESGEAPAPPVEVKEVAKEASIAPTAKHILAPGIHIHSLIV